MHIPEDNDSVCNHQLSQFSSSKQYECDVAGDNANLVELNFLDKINLDLPLNIWVDISVVILLRANTESQQNHNDLVIVEDERVEGT